MAISIEDLAGDKKLWAQQIISNLEGIKPNANRYAKELVDLQAEIDSSQSLDEFYEVVGRIVNLDKAIGQLLPRDNDVIKVISQRIHNDPQSSSIEFLLDFLSDFSTVLAKIAGVKERFLTKQLCDKLSDKEKNAAMNYIGAVKSLKSTSEHLNRQKDEFRTRLEQASTLDEVSTIEEEIHRQDAACRLIVSATVPYPENENTAGLIIDFMDSNDHLMNILRSFNFAPHLEDDVLHATGRLSLPSPSMK